MKNISLALIFVIFSFNTKTMAQAKDSIPTKNVIEQGAKGDIILGKQNKQNQLTAAPQQLQQKDSLHKEASTHPKKKKSKNKNRKNRK